MNRHMKRCEWCDEPKIKGDGIIGNHNIVYCSEKCSEKAIKANHSKHWTKWLNSHGKLVYDPGL